MLPGDQFIYQQIGSWLANEPAVYTAYLQTASGGGVVGGLTTKAYWAALTATRLYLIETRVGAFQPLYENHGVRTIERNTITGVHTGMGRTTVALLGGEQLVFNHDRAVKHASGQTALFDELHMRHGGGQVAADIGRSSKLKMVGGIAIGLVIVAFTVYKQVYGGRAEVAVNCAAAGDEFVCHVKHTSGGAEANVCWDVKLECADDKMSVAHTCTDVDAGETTTVRLGESDFRGIEACAPPVQTRLLNLEVKPR